MRYLLRPHEHRFPDAHGLAQTLAAEIQVDLQEAVDMRGVASLAVSGGRTPVALFEQLASETLSWDKVWVTLVDERWVDAQDSASNEHLLRTHLLHNKASAAHFIGLKNSGASPQEGADWAWRALARLSRPIDVVLLGMGNDGHTASLFPGTPQLHAALDMNAAAACVATVAPVAPTQRLSFNVAALLDARRIILHIQGADKWAVYQQALAEGPEAALPIRAVLRQQRVPVDVFWSP